MKQNTKKHLKKAAYFVSVAVVGLVFGLALQFAKAWTEPGVPAPGGNVGAPINTSSNWQAKLGGLGTSYSEITNSGEPTLYFHRPGIFATGIKLRNDNSLWFGGWSVADGAADIVAGVGKFGASAQIGTGIPAGYYQDGANGAYRSLNVGGDTGYYFQNYGGGTTTMMVGLQGSNAGKVGIGTITPRSKLSVGAAGAIGDAIYGGGTLIGVDGNGSLAGVQGTGTNVGVYGTASTMGVYGNAISNNGIGVYGLANVNNGIGGLFTSTVAGRALITLNGNVGIGTLNPTQKLTVAGTIEITGGGALKFPDGTQQATAALPVALSCTTRTGVTEAYCIAGEVMTGGTCQGDDVCGGSDSSSYGALFGTQNGFDGIQCKQIGCTTITAHVRCCK